MLSVRKTKNINNIVINNKLSTYKVCAPFFIIKSIMDKTQLSKKFTHHNCVLRH